MQDIATTDRYNTHSSYLAFNQTDPELPPRRVGDDDPATAGSYFEGHVPLCPREPQPGNPRESGTEDNANPYNLE